MYILKEFISALKKGDIQHCFLLCERHPDLAKTEINGVSLPLTCLFYNQYELANELARNKVELDLFEASALGISQTIKLLIEKGENPDAVASNGFTPLALACYYGQYEAVKWLLTLGANVNKPIENESGFSPLHAAVLANSFPIVEFLLSKGAFINAKQKDGATALYLAVEARNIELARFFIEQKASYNSSIDNGTSLKKLLSEINSSEFDALFKTMK